MDESTQRLIKRVAARTKGTAGDPLSEADVEQVVCATLEELRERFGIDVPQETDPPE